MVSLTYRPDKLKELILYIVEKSKGDPMFGATKLNKLLFYCDFLAYATWGTPITGAKYYKLDKGPAPRALVPLRSELLEAKFARLDSVLYFGREQQRLVVLRKPDLALFTGNELELVNRVIDAFKSVDGSGVSHISHREIGWKVAANKEDIPYETAFLSARSLTPTEVARVQEIAQEHGWI